MLWRGRMLRGGCALCGGPTPRNDRFGGFSLGLGCLRQFGRLRQLDARLGWLGACLSRLGARFSRHGRLRRPARPRGALLGAPPRRLPAGAWTLRAGAGQAAQHPRLLARRGRRCSTGGGPPPFGLLVGAHWLLTRGMIAHKERRWRRVSIRSTFFGCGERGPELRLSGQVLEVLVARGVAGDGCSLESQ